MWCRVKHLLQGILHFDLTHPISALLEPRPEQWNPLARQRLSSSVLPSNRRSSGGQSSWQFCRSTNPDLRLIKAKLRQTGARKWRQSLRPAGHNRWSYICPRAIVCLSVLRSVRWTNTNDPFWLLLVIEVAARRIFCSHRLRSKDYYAGHTSYHSDVYRLSFEPQFCDSSFRRHNCCHCFHCCCCCIGECIWSLIGCRYSRCWRAQCGCLSTDEWTAKSHHTVRVKVVGAWPLPIKSWLALRTWLLRHYLHCLLWGRP